LVSAGSADFEVEDRSVAKKFKHRFPDPNIKIYTKRRKENSADLKQQ
jgi:hypothetical protein